MASFRVVVAIMNPAALVAGSTWTPKSFNITAFCAVFSGFGPLFYIPWKSRRLLGRGEEANK